MPYSTEFAIFVVFVCWILPCNVWHIYDGLSSFCISAWKNLDFTSCFNTRNQFTMLIIHVLLVIVAILIIIPLFISRDPNYEKSVLIAASKERVWSHVSTLAAMDAWSPWNARDPDMHTTLTGKDGEPGAKKAWISDKKNVGEGSRTIVAVDKPNKMRTKLEFIKPFKSEADAYINLDSEDEKTRVTWGFESRMAYPMNIMKLFMNFEKNMDKDFGAGLASLNKICEA
jgi:hypothetical protein